MLQIKLNNETIKQLKNLEIGETLESTYKGLECYIEKVEKETQSNLQIGKDFFAFNFFFPSVVVANPQTIAQFLKSKSFKAQYRCWGYAWRVYNQYGEDVGEKYELYDDEKYNIFINTKIVIKTLKGWELNDSHEMDAFCKIYIEE